MTVRTPRIYLAANNGGPTCQLAAKTTASWAFRSVIAWYALPISSLVGWTDLEHRMVTRPLACLLGMLAGCSSTSMNTQGEAAPTLQHHQDLDDAIDGIQAEVAVPHLSLALVDADGIVWSRRAGVAGLATVESTRQNQLCRVQSTV